VRAGPRSLVEPPAISRHHVRPGHRARSGHGLTPVGRIMDRGTGWWTRRRSVRAAQAGSIRAAVSWRGSGMGPRRGVGPAGRGQLGRA
jgi:hypothetical protein